MWVHLSEEINKKHLTTAALERGQFYKSPGLILPFQLYDLNCSIRALTRHCRGEVSHVLDPISALH